MKVLISGSDQGGVANAAPGALGAKHSVVQGAHLHLARAPLDAQRAANSPEEVPARTRGRGEPESFDSVQALRSRFPRWTGEWLAGAVVSSQEERALVVLWLGLGDVVLAAMPAALSQAHAGAVRERIDHLSLALVAEVGVTPAVITAIRQGQLQPQQTRRTPGPIAPDEIPLRVWDEMFEAARLGGASDIHFSIPKLRDGNGTIRLRLSGRLREWRSKVSPTLLRSALTAAFGQRLVSGTATRSTVSWDAEIAFMTQHNAPNGTLWKGRCNGRPALNQYPTVVRLLESNPTRLPTLEQLGYVESHVDMLRTAVRRNSGVVVIFGSTGSGKSTTLRTFIAVETDTTSLAVYSAESPAEYVLPGVHQFSIPVEVNMTAEETAEKFLAALRDVVRMDPDVLMVGEIRDRESAGLVAEFANSGHRCYTTAHGDGAVDGLMRLCGEQIQMPAELLTGRKFLTASIYQRLLPRLCPSCRIEAADPKKGLPIRKQMLLRSKFGLSLSGMYVANPTGCPHCTPAVPGMKPDGRNGVALAAEVLLPDGAMREAAGRRDWSEVARLWRATRQAQFDDPDMMGKTAFECALYLAAQGIVSIVDVETEFEALESYEVQPIVPTRLPAKELVD
jgi:general secretion pathway protein E